MSLIETLAEVMRKQGITRRGFGTCYAMISRAFGLGPSFVPKIAHAMKTKLHAIDLGERVGLHLLQRMLHPGAHPLAKEVVRSMINLDDRHRLMAAAGHQA